MSLKLKEVTKDDLGRTHITYELQHVGEKTTLTLDLEAVVMQEGSFEVSLTLKTPPCASLDEGLAKLVDYLDRSADGIQGRGKDGVVIPLFNT